MISIIIVNYNVPEMTDSLVEHISKSVKVPYKLHVIDNGSDSRFVSKYTTLRIETNRQKTGGLLTGMHIASRDNPEYYWNISTNMQFLPSSKDPAFELRKELRRYENAVAITPHFTGELPDWTHRKFTRNENIVSHHKVDGIGMYAMFNAKWLDSIGWFDPTLSLGWGADFELKYLAKKQKKIFLVHDKIGYKITKSEVFKLKRDESNLEDFQTECNLELERVMTRKYGKHWRDVLGAYE